MRQMGFSKKRTKKNHNAYDECILIVEDDEGILEVMKEILKEEKYRILTARSAAKAYNLLHTFTPHLFIVDYWLSDGDDGLSFIHWVRKQREYEPIPIIFTTAVDEVPEKAKKVNKMSILKKPFDVSVFVKAVKNCLNS